MAHEDTSLEGLTQQEITEQGNPRKPTGTAGKAMLERMNASHAEVTWWGLGFGSWENVRSALDIGCGGGATLARLAKLAPEAQVYGLDYSSVSVEESRAHNADLVDKSRLEVTQGSVEAMPYASGSMDAIVTVESFYFWPDPAQNLCEVRRVLAPAGTFLLIADVYERPDLSDEVRASVRHYDLFNPNEQQFAELLEQAGFVDVRVHTKEGTTWLCAEGHAPSAS